MKSERTNRRDRRPMTPDKNVRSGQDAVRGGDEPAAAEALRDHGAEQDRLTKSGRLRIEDVEKSNKKRR